MYLVGNVYLVEKICQWLSLISYSFNQLKSFIQHMPAMVCGFSNVGVKKITHLSIHHQWNSNTQENFQTENRHIYLTKKIIWYRSFLNWETNFILRFHEEGITLKTWLDKGHYSGSLFLLWKNAVTQTSSVEEQLTGYSPSLRVSEQNLKQASGGKGHKDQTWGSMFWAPTETWQCLRFCLSISTSTKLITSVHVATC